MVAFERYAVYASNKSQPFIGINESSTWQALLDGIVIVHNAFFVRLITGEAQIHVR